MPTFYFCPAQDSLPASTVQDYATAYLTAFYPKSLGDPHVVVDALPPTLDLDTVLERLDPGARDAARAHLVEQDQRLRPIAEQQIPQLTGEPHFDLTVRATADTWRGHPPGTLIAVRQTTPVRVVGVFEEWRLDAAGRLGHTPAAPFQARPVPASTKVAAARFTADDPGQTFADVTLTLTNYVGQFLSMSGLPGIGLLITLLSVLTQQAVDGSFSRGPGLLDVFKKLLEANKISLENDLAGAVILNYRDYGHTHYSDAWLQEVMNAPDPLPSDIKSKVAKLEDFIEKVTDDFDGTSDLFTAVDLMRVSAPKAGDPHDATEAMLKAEGFFYMGNVALTLGRQAFNAQYTMNGPKQAAKIADLLASYSQIYTDYASALKSSVDDQTTDRVNMLHAKDVGGEAWIWDYFYDRLVWTEKCCGGDDCNAKARERDGALAQMRETKKGEYRTDLCHLFWDGSMASFDQAVASMVDNNAKLQQLAKDCKEQA